MNFALTLTAAQAWVFLPLVLPICLWACYTDITEFKISNKAVLALIGVFVVLGPFALEFQEYLWRYTHFLAVIAIGFVLWRVIGIGAGDAKIAAAIAPFVALSDVSAVLIIWLLAMTAMLFVYALPRFIPEAREIGVWKARKMPVPFGIALAPTLAAYLILGITQGGM